LFDAFSRRINAIYPMVSISKLVNEPVWGAVYLAANVMDGTIK